MTLSPLCAKCIDTMYHPGGETSVCDCTCHPVEGDHGPAHGWMFVVLPQADSRAAQAAYETHSWTPPEGRCFNCDVRPGGEASRYPCGTTAPRVVVRNIRENVDTAVASVLRGVVTGEELAKEQSR